MTERDGMFRRRRTDGRRPHRTVIKHSDEEWARVQSIARAQGVSVPRLYEQSLHAGDVVAAAKLSQIYAELLVIQRLMANAASNINQVAKVANSTGDVEEDRLLAAYGFLRQQADRLSALMNDLPSDGFYEGRL
ncbi:hypothetical protein [Calidifontibacter terrae]